MRIALVLVSLLTLAACTKAPEEQAAAPSVPAAAVAPPAPASSPATADASGFTEEGFVFSSAAGMRHVVRLPAPGTDTWQPASSGEPVVKQVGSRKETTPEGKAAIVFEYETVQPGTVSIEFQRMEDGEVEGKRTISFVVS